MATPHRLLAAVYTHGPRFSGFEQQVTFTTCDAQFTCSMQANCLGGTAASLALLITRMSTSLLLSMAQDAQDFLYFLLERASEELKEVVTTFIPSRLSRPRR